MKKKDYRTWWMIGCDVASELGQAHGETGIQMANYDFDDTEIDPVLEQLWAIREGLA